MLMESHTQILLVTIKKTNCFHMFVYLIRYHMLNLMTSFEYLVAGRPVYYVLIQCGTKEYRSKLSKGSNFVSD